MQLGRTWTGLIVAQVAFVVALMPIASYQGWDLMRYGLAEPGFAANEFLTARVALDQATPPSAQAESYQQAFTEGLLEDAYGERVTSTMLTDEGRTALAAMGQHTQEVVASMLARLDDRDRARLYDGLTVLHKLLTSNERQDVRHET